MAECVMSMDVAAHTNYLDEVKERAQLLHDER